MTRPTTTNEATLYYKGGTSDKFYHIWIEKVGANYTVKYENGRRGHSPIGNGTKIGPTLNKEVAIKMYDLVVAEKLAKGYRAPLLPAGGILSGSVMTTASGSSGGLAGTTGLGTTISAGTSVEGATMGTVARRSSEGHISGMITSEPGLKAFAVPGLGVPFDRGEGGPVISCQLLNPITKPQLDVFMKHDDWVMQEKHDGRRIMLANHRKYDNPVCMNRLGKKIEPLSEFAACCNTHFKDFQFCIDGEAVGDKFYAFDILRLETIDCTSLPLEERLINLGMLIRSAGRQDTIVQVYTADTFKSKRALFAAVESGGREGVCIKDRHATYTAGRPNSGGPALKYKLVETVTCKVIAHSDKRSVFLAVNGKGQMINMGKVTIPPNHEMPKIDQVIEVQYLYAYPEGALYQPVYKGVRDDVPVDEYDTLKFKSEIIDIGVRLS